MPTESRRIVELIGRCPMQQRVGRLERRDPGYRLRRVRGRGHARTALEHVMVQRLGQVRWRRTWWWKRSSESAPVGGVALAWLGPDSDIDLLVRVPRGASSFGLVRFQRLLQEVLGRKVDLGEYGGLKAGLDDDIRREAVPM